LRILYATRTSSSEPPEWPILMYTKLRKDIYLLAGAAVLLAVVFILIEKAKLHRNDLLVYRCMAREIEKLRQRVKSLESTGKKQEATPESKPEDAQE